LLTGDVENEHMTKWVYTFGDGHAEGSAADRNLLGGKGANLAEMCNLGLPVPPGLTITTDACVWYYDNGRFGDRENPLLVSVRSGARVSMPGMMDTVLNLGLNDETVEGLAARSGDRRFAYDSYRRFIQMYADVVLGVDHHDFEDMLGEFKEENDYELDTDITADQWAELISRYKAPRRRGNRRSVSAGRVRPGLGRHRSCLPVLAVGPRHHLPQAQRDSG
jgi:pyruvate,orthophosphate dikinase